MAIPRYATLRAVKTIRFDSIQSHERVNSIQLDSIHCKQESNTKSQTSRWNYNSSEVNKWARNFATELLIAFVEASDDIDANVSHDAILQHSVARSSSVAAVVLNRNFSLRFGSVNRFETIFPSLLSNADVQHVYRPGHRPSSHG